MSLRRHLDGPHARPFAVLAACIILLAAVDGGHGRFLSAATAYSTLQTFATISLVTLGLGLTMMIREFDLSVVGMYGMAGCIAVLDRHASSLARALVRAGDRPDRRHRAGRSSSCACTCRRSA